MDNFKIIYKVLRILEKAMDCEEFDRETISAEALGISEERWRRIFMLLSNEGYISGFFIKRGLGDMYYVAGSGPEITLKGLEYLEENSMMKKAANLVKGVADIL